MIKWSNSLFSAFYGQYLVAVAGTNPSPWSIVSCCYRGKTKSTHFKFDKTHFNCVWHTGAALFDFNYISIHLVSKERVFLLSKNPSWVFWWAELCTAQHCVAWSVWIHWDSAVLSCAGLWPNNYRKPVSDFPDGNFGITIVYFQCGSGFSTELSSASQIGSIGGQTLVEPLHWYPGYFVCQQVSNSLRFLPLTIFGWCIVHVHSAYCKGHYVQCA